MLQVDAALDLSHTQNIGRMIKTHFPYSQFIVVSLKEGMFSNANVIFRTRFVDGVSAVTRSVNSSKCVTSLAYPIAPKLQLGHGCMLEQGMFSYPSVMLCTKFVTGVSAVTRSVNSSTCVASLAYPTPVRAQLHGNCFAEEGTIIKASVMLCTSSLDSNAHHSGPCQTSLPRFQRQEADRQSGCSWCCFRM